VTDSSDTHRETIQSPEALLALIPHLLGFMPESSLVVIGTEPTGTLKVTLRFNLPDFADPEDIAGVASYAVAILAARRFRMASAVGYGPAQVVTPLVDALKCAAEIAGIGHGEILRAENGRYWSCTCRDTDCCPAEGTPFDPSSHPVWAARVAKGSQVLSGRSELVASIGPVTGAAAESVRRAARQAWQQHASRITKTLHAQGDLAAAEKAIADKDLAAVRDFIATYRNSRHATDYQMARVASALQDFRIRDDAWARMDPDHVDCHLRMWIDVVRRALPSYVAAPASLLAFVAWQSGNGALANIALDRALADNPDYSMADLLRNVIGAGAPPSMARLRMTPEEVAAHYRDLDETLEEDPPNEDQDESAPAMG
jgi:hypothetical protein